jgi:hypothetical protein
MRIFLIAFIIASISFIAQAYAESMPVGLYKSLDGKIEHDFKPSGDYLGNYAGTYTRKDSGLYQQGSGVCKSSQGASGNILLYFNNEQCCLRFQKISDKWTVSFIGSSFSYIGQHGVCSNGVFVRNIN